MCLALVLSSCAAPPSTLTLRGRVELPDQSPIDVRIALQPEHAPDADRYLSAAVSALQTCATMTGPLDIREIALLDPSWNERDAIDPSAMLDRVPWWTTVASMLPELAAARGISRRCWLAALGSGDLPPWFVEGLAEFTARRVVLPIFARGSNAPGYAFFDQRYFAGFLPRFTWIRLLPETDGRPVDEYRAHQHVDAKAVARSNDQALAGKMVLALGTLERWLGRPVFDGILLQFARESKARAPQLADFERVASDVSGQQLSWFFDQTLRSSAVFDYGVDALNSEPDAGGGFVTTVTARRYGDAVFAGASGTRTAGFDHGRGIALRVRFANGEQHADWWDGRDERRTFRYRSPARAAAAIVDPGRVLLLDLNQTNNSRTLSPRATAAATRWSARWVLWLEHLVLTYASLA